MKQRYVMSVAHKEMRGLSYLIYSAVSLSLLLAMVLLPLAPAFADEIEPSNVSDETSTPADPSEVIADDEGNAETSTQNDITQNNETSTDTEIDILEDVVALATTDSINEFATEEPASAEDDGVVHDDVPTTDDSVSDEIVDGEEDEGVLPTDTTDEYQGSDENNETAETDDTTATENTTEVMEELTESNADTSGGVVVVNTLTNDENKFSFSENECTTVGDGTFYCTTASSAPEIIEADRIFSAVDADGDKEIYIEKDGELSPITSNTFDDDAPYYDEGSNTAVWHRLIDGRYQIISFDFEDEEEEQLTHDRYNNMEPSRFGDTIVWQGWVGDDWEIFILEGDELTMLTDNTVHDIAPSVNGTHVVWQSFEENAWRMKVYDMRTKIIDTIENTEGGSIENPRFVLVYDTKLDTGDIETNGYDLKSGEVVRLASEPVSLPKEIPDPDQTGEERALVTTITQLKPKTEDESGDEPLPDTTGTSTPNGSTDIVVPPIYDLSTTTTTDIDEQMNILQVEDVVLPLVVIEETQDTSHIEDVIVTPYASPIATSTDTH